MNPSRLLTAALAALTFFATPASHAQGLGGLLNAAKTKASQAGTGVRQATQSAPGALPANGEDPPTPPEMTPETQAEYTRLLLSDTRPVVPGQMNGSYTNWYRQLRQLEKFPIRFTWDQSALTQATEKRLWLFGNVEDFSGDLVSSLHANSGSYLRPRLAKVTEIHYTATTKPNPSNSDVPGEGQGWFFSFNPATGVLTAAFNSQSTAVDAWKSLSKWIVKNVN